MGKGKFSEKFSGKIDKKKKEKENKPEEKLTNLCTISAARYLTYPEFTTHHAKQHVIKDNPSSSTTPPFPPLFPPQLYAMPLGPPPFSAATLADVVVLV